MDVLTDWLGGGGLYAIVYDIVYIICGSSKLRTSFKRQLEVDTLLANASVF